MGRYQGSSGGGAGGNAPIIKSAVPAGEQIQRGDIVLVGADGKGYAAALPSDSALAQALRPTGGGPQANNIQITAKTALGTSLTGAGADLYDVIELTNKNVLVAALDGTNSIGKPLFSVLDPEGNVVVSPRGVANIAGSDAGRNISVVALPNGGFVLAYITSSGTWLAVYDSTGNQVLPPFQVGPAGFYAVRAARLSNNSIAIFTAGTSASVQTFNYSVYKTDGTLVKAAANIATSGFGTWNDRCIGVTGLTGGGFVLGWVQGTASSAATMYWRVFDNAGAPIGSTAFTLWPQASTGLLGYCYLAPLSDGGFAVAAYSATVGAHMGIFNAAGALRVPVINLGLPENVTYGNSVAIAAGPNGTIGAIVATASGVVGSVYSSAGVALAAPRVIDSYVTNQSCGSLWFNEDGSSFAAISSTANNGAAKVIFLNPAFYVASTWQSTYSQSSSWGRPKVMGVSNPKVDVFVYMLFYQQSPTTAIGMASNVASRQALTTLGVATNTVEKDGQVGVQMTGMAPLRRPFMLPWTTNQQSATPPGQRMYTVGSTAVMSGIQPVAPNPIN